MNGFMQGNGAGGLNNESIALVWFIGFQGYFFCLKTIGLMSSYYSIRPLASGNYAGSGMGRTLLDTFGKNQTHSPTYVHDEVRSRSYKIIFANHKYRPSLLPADTSAIVVNEPDKPG
jgi:hypothetical protein